MCRPQPPEFLLIELPATVIGTVIVNVMSTVPISCIVTSPALLVGLLVRAVAALLSSLVVHLNGIAGMGVVVILPFVVLLRQHRPRGACGHWGSACGCGTGLPRCRYPSSDGLEVIAIKHWGRPAAVRIRP